MDVGQVDLFLGVQLVGVAVMVKFVVRSLCTKTAGTESLELRQRLFFLFEHVVFSLAAYYVIIYLPGSGSWYFFPRKCWAYPPSCPSDAFHYFYIAKMGTHIEDVLFRFSNFYVLRLKSEQCSINGTVDSNGSGNSKAANRSDMMMDIHHIATAVLCLLSYFSGNRCRIMLTLILESSDEKSFVYWLAYRLLPSWFSADAGSRCE